MSSQERTGMRDLTYSRWHRTESTRRFLGWLGAAELTAIDIDFVEYCACCKVPLALIETQASDQSKPATVTTALGQMANIPVYSVGYDSDGAVPADIVAFHVRQLWPTEGARDEVFLPDAYAHWLRGMRLTHEPVCKTRTLPMLRPSRNTWSGVAS